jgi:hypothetical protein
LEFRICSLGIDFFYQKGELEQNKRQLFKEVSMIELWTAIGLAVSDLDFNEDLQKVTKVRGKREALKKLIELLREYGFRMSAYEAAELLRIIKTPNALKAMAEVHNIIWFRMSPCLWAWSEAALSRDFQLPYLVFDNKPGKNVMATVDPLTGEPSNNETFVVGAPATGTGQVPQGKKRFEKAK